MPSSRLLPGCCSVHPPIPPYRANRPLWGRGGRPVSCEELDRDRYRRVVAKCAVDGVDIGEWMVSQGWAVAYYFYSYDYSRAEQRARSARRGMWAGEFEKPWEWRKQRRTRR